MRAWNRVQLLWGYLARHTRLRGLPVEYIVETTAKCNLYCPMCPRETHKQPKADMSDEHFSRLVEQSGRTAEHMMLIGLGEPLMDPQIFDRIELCARHTISTLISTNGTFLDEKTAARLLRRRSSRSRSASMAQPRRASSSTARERSSRSARQLCALRAHEKGAPIEATDCRADGAHGT